MSGATEESNDKHLAPWSEACTQDSVSNTPLSPYLGKLSVCVCTLVSSLCVCVCTLVSSLCVCVYLGQLSVCVCTLVSSVCVCVPWSALCVCVYLGQLSVCVCTLVSSLCVCVPWSALCVCVYLGQLCVYNHVLRTDQELLYNRHLHLDGGKLRTLGFDYRVPKPTLDLLREVGIIMVLLSSHPLTCTTPSRGLPPHMYTPPHMYYPPHLY